MLLNLVKAYFLQDFDRFSKADYAGIIGRTGFISLRSFLVILPGIADDLDRPAPVKFRHMLIQHLCQANDSAASEREYIL